MKFNVSGVQMIGLLTRMRDSYRSMSVEDQEFRQEDAAYEAHMANVCVNLLERVALREDLGDRLWQSPVPLGNQFDP